MAPVRCLRSSPISTRQSGRITRQSSRSTKAKPLLGTNQKKSKITKPQTGRSAKTRTLPKTIQKEPKVPANRQVNKKDGRNKTVPVPVVPENRDSEEEERENQTLEEEDQENVLESREGFNQNVYVKQELVEEIVGGDPYEEVRNTLLASADEDFDHAQHRYHKTREMIYGLYPLPN